MSRPPELPGFRFERPLGSGGYSDVYLYRQQLPARLVAVKVLRASGLDAAHRPRFTAEANAMAGLADHPNIVSVFSASISDDGRPYLVMQYYSQPNLSVRAASERLAVAEVLRVGIQIASAVETAHRAGILHRDIKPANLLISQYGAPGLTDFGIAGQLADIGSAHDEDHGVSVPWAAPEVLYATGPTSIRSDVYSLAATLWHLLVGRSPFEERGGDNSTFALMRRVRDMPPPVTGRPDVPPSLDRLLRQSMAKDPAARPGSAIEVARRLQAVELELSLPRTEIVVTTDADAAGPAVPPPAHYSTAPSTVARPLSVTAQQPPPAAGVTGPTHDRPVPPTNVRPGRHDPQADGAPPRPRRTGAVVAAVAAVVVVAGGVALAVSAGGDDDPGPRSTVSQPPGTQNAGLPGQDIPPGRPTVSGRQDGERLVFTWRYSARRSDDTYQWRETTGARRRGVTEQPRLALRARPGDRRTCVEVKVIRADGTNASATFSPEGCT
ncbi:serine/threonine-protein kinase [Jatrophihabitans fulvus]